MANCRSALTGRDLEPFFEQVGDLVMLKYRLMSTIDTLKERFISLSEMVEQFPFQPQVLLQIINLVVLYYNFIVSFVH